jgi:hypothetical protein
MLQPLLADLCAARHALADARHGARAGSPRITQAQGVLFGALDRYVRALTVRGLPVPYTLRDELRITRGVHHRG